jgi:hypothetical protein
MFQLAGDRCQVTLIAGRRIEWVGVESRAVVQRGSGASPAGLSGNSRSSLEEATVPYSIPAVDRDSRRRRRCNISGNTINEQKLVVCSNQTTKL